MNDLMQMAEDYRHYAQKKSNAHYRMADKAEANGRYFGIPVTVATTIVGTSIFANLSKATQNASIQIATGFLSLAAAVVSALQTFFNFSKSASQHRDAAADYEAVRHELDSFLIGASASSSPETIEVENQALRKISLRLDEIAKRAPTIPDKVYDSVQTRVATRPIIGARERAISEKDPQGPKI